MNGMLLTAGLGTRLRPLTDVYAKPNAPFLNIPLIYYSLFLLKKSGVDRFVFNTHYLPEQIAALAHQIQSSGIHVDLSHEPGRPLGPGGGIKKAEQFLRGRGDFIVCNGDEVILPRTTNIFSEFVSEHRRSKALATLLVMKHPLVGTQFGGVWCDQNKNVLGFGKTRWPASVDGFHFIGPMMFQERIFDYLPEGESNILYDGLTKAIAKGERVRVVVDDFTWFETGNPHDFLNASKEALEILHYGKGADADFLRNLVGEMSQGNSVVEKTPDALILHSKRSPIDFKNVHCKGFVVANENARVAAGAQLENVVLIDDVEIQRDEIRRNEIIFRRP